MLYLKLFFFLQGRHDIENAAELQDFLKTSKKYGLKYLSSTANSKEFGKYMSSTSFARYILLSWLRCKLRIIVHGTL